MTAAIAAQPEALLPRGASFRGLRFFPGYLGRDRQAALVARLRDIFSIAPLFTPRMTISLSLRKRKLRRSASSRLPT